MMDDLHHSLSGSLLGLAVGDAIALPYEGLSKRRVQKMLGNTIRHRFVLRRGMVSDDTEHACAVAQSLIAAGDNPQDFLQQLAKRLRWWLLAVPAGIGLATLKSTIKLCVGVSPKKSGVFSAGNGPAMRSPILGAAIRDSEQLRQFVRCSTRITHTDPKAEFGAWGVAFATRWAIEHENVEPSEFVQALRASLQDDDAEEFLALVTQALTSFEAGHSLEEFANQLGLSRGVTGYIYHTVPAVLFAWWTFPRDYPAAIESITRCGGDTDTTAAILGGIIGPRLGKTAFRVIGSITFGNGRERSIGWKISRKNWQKASSKTNR